MPRAAVRSGYTRDFPLERLYRDNRLNQIHEGTFGIQGMDLLGRKVAGDRGETLGRFVGMMRETVSAALAVERLPRLANATVYLDAFGHVVVGWIWLQQALVAAGALAGDDLSTADRAFYEGKLLACRYFSRYELPLAVTRLALCSSLEATCLDAPVQVFCN